MTEQEIKAKLWVGSATYDEAIKLAKDNNLPAAFIEEMETAFKGGPGAVATFLKGDETAEDLIEDDVDECDIEDEEDDGYGEDDEYDEEEYDEEEYYEEDDD